MNKESYDLVTITFIINICIIQYSEKHFIMIALTITLWTGVIIFPESIVSLSPADYVP